jgi:hypothetical protein
MLAALQHPLNWQVGWGLILLSFVSGAIIGLWFHRDDFGGGYASLRRRMWRLGHIALAALGMLNLLFSMGPTQLGITSWILISGSIAMPLVCFATAWRAWARHLFFIPVSLLFATVILVLLRGVPS